MPARTAAVHGKIMVRNSSTPHLRGMTDAKVRELQVTLRKKEAMLQQWMARRDGIVVERAADPSDEAQYALECELSISALDRDAGVLSAVRSALQRIEEGAYGLCQSCDEEISEKRLAALPWALYCIACQESMDRGVAKEELLPA